MALEDTEIQERFSARNMWANFKDWETTRGKGEILGNNRCKSTEIYENKKDEQMHKDLQQSLTQQENSLED